MFHGRVKPENIMITENGRIVVCDVFPNTFNYLTRTYQNKSASSPIYQAPEYTSQAEDIDLLLTYPN